MSQHPNDPNDPKDYSDGRTTQAFESETNINKILAKHQNVLTQSHLNQFGGEYGDFADYDLQEAFDRVARAREIFDALPSQVRRDFNQDPRNFLAFVNHPDNVDRLDEILPAISAPGHQFPNVGGTPQVPPAVGDPVDPPVEPPVPPVAPPGGGEGG